MSNKILGYMLLAIGLIAIISTVYYSYNIFTAKISAPSVFRIASPVQQQKTGNNIQDQVNQAVADQIIQMLPPDTIPKALNLLSWSIFATILIGAGAAVAGLGIKMLK
jgi:uncharacterized protein involved in cysteine biosynthesis